MNSSCSPRSRRRPDGTLRRGPHRRIAGWRRSSRALLLSFSAYCQRHPVELSLSPSPPKLLDSGLVSPVRGKRLLSLDVAVLGSRLVSPVRAQRALGSVEVRADSSDVTGGTLTPSRSGPGVDVRATPSFEPVASGQRRRLLASLFAWGDRAVGICLGSSTAWTAGIPHGILSPRLASNNVHVSVPLDVQEQAHRIRSIIDKMEPLTLGLTSCFSGIGTAEMCGQAITEAFLAADIPVSLEFKGGFEIKRQARYLSQVMAPEASFGGDLLALRPPHIKDRLEQPFVSFEALRSFLDSNTAWLRSDAVCPDTGKVWKIDLGDIHFGGNPCTDWSLIGKQPGCLGPTMPALFTWALLIRRHKPLLLLQENVPQFPLVLLLDLLHQEYKVDSLLLDPRRLGWPVARARRYAIFSRTNLPGHPLSLTALLPLLDTTYQVGDASLFAVAPGPYAPPSKRELSNLRGYLRPARSGRKRVLVDLAQNALIRSRGSTVDNALCTITCSSTRLYLVAEARCLSGDELLLAQGFPALDWCAKALGCFPMHRALSTFSNHAEAQLAGNAMHSNCLGLTLRWAVVQYLLPFKTVMRGVPRPVRAHSRSPFLRALAEFVAHSPSPVARSVRAAAIPYANRRQRDLFPLPDLSSKLDLDPPGYLRKQARLSCRAQCALGWWFGHPIQFRSAFGGSERSALSCTSTFCRLAQ